MELLHRLPRLVPSDAAERSGAVDLWCFFYESVRDPDLLSAYDALMTEAERERHRRFVFERDRLLFLATRALVRTALSNYADVPPADWRFAADERGKPHVVGPSTEPIYFNLTNTHGLVVCAVSRAHAHIGEPRVPWLALCLSPCRRRA